MAKATKDIPSYTITENKSFINITKDKTPSLSDTKKLENANFVDELKENDAKQNEDVRKQTILEQHGLHVGRQIGCGSYAKVKIGYSESLKCIVAIKIISKYHAPEDFVNVFMPRELEIVRSIRHENIIRFYQSIETNHRVYIIMQYAEHGSLLDLIRKVNFIPERKSRKIFRQLINAVEYCHSIGVVHRDIKCENLLLDTNYTLKLIDFGFARNKMNATDDYNNIYSKTYCGSYAYASPEILKGTPYQPQYSDVWSTGVVLFAMVCGRIPFDDTSVRHLIKQVQSKVSFPRQPKLSTECKGLIQRILAPLASRANIVEIKEHAWFCSTDVEEIEVKDKAPTPTDESSLATPPTEEKQ